MSVDPATKDLVVLAADKDIEFTIRGLLRRAPSLNIRPPTVDHFVHAEHDAGCRASAHSLLAGLSKQYDFALVVFDHDGCGHESSSPAEVEREVEERLAATGWRGRSAAIAIVPELEVWVWSPSPHVAKALGWHGRTPSLRDWLLSEGHITPERPKPQDPKTVMRKALRVATKPLSPSIFQELASTVGLTTCSDPAFAKLQRTLREWFPQSP